MKTLSDLAYEIIVHGLALWGLMDIIAEASPAGWPL